MTTIPRDRVVEKGGLENFMFFGILLVAAAMVLSSIGVVPSGGISARELTLTITNAIAKNMKIDVAPIGIPKAKSTVPDPSGRLSGIRPSALALSTIPPNYLDLCFKWGAFYKVAWPLGCSVLKEETAFGQGSGAGISSGINFADCCRGPAQFNTENGKGKRINVDLPNNHSYSYLTTSTWAGFKADGNKDGVFDIFNPEDAIPAMFHKLAANGATSRSGWAGALWHYNQSTAYGRAIIARAELYGVAA